MDGCFRSSFVFVSSKFLIDRSNVRVHVLQFLSLQIINLVDEESIGEYANADGEAGVDFVHFQVPRVRLQDLTSGHKLC